MRCLIVIPARMGASRFPGKPLADLLGKPMIQWVYEAAVASGVADRVVIAAPDQKIIDAARSFGAEAILTSHDHPTGTDRIAEVARKIEADVYVNVQGDEPLIKPESISACAAPLLASPSLFVGDGSCTENEEGGRGVEREGLRSKADMASIYTYCPPEDYDNPATVKVVTELDGYALYFSRYPIPFMRNCPPPAPSPLAGTSHPESGEGRSVKKHVGLYAYRREPLLAFSEWGMSPLETAESLEQLRFMEHGVRIFMSEAEGTELAVDTPEQADQVRRILSARL